MTEECRRRGGILSRHMPPARKAKKAPPKARTPPSRAVPKVAKVVPKEAKPAPKEAAVAPKGSAAVAKAGKVVPRGTTVAPPALKAAPRGPKGTPDAPKVSAPRAPPVEPEPEEKPEATLRPVALTDAAEDVGDTFEEALLERLAQEDGRGWRAGPVVALPMDRLAAGHLGWMTTLSAPGIFTLGTIHLLVIPGTSRTPPTELPLLDADWEQFDSVEHFAGPPRLLLLARARDPVKKPDVRQLAHDVFERLTAELAPGRARRTARS